MAALAEAAAHASALSVLPPTPGAAGAPVSDGRDPRFVEFYDRVTGQLCVVSVRFGSGLTVKLRSAHGKDHKVHSVSRLNYHPAEKIVRRTTTAREVNHSLTCHIVGGGEPIVLHLPMQRGLRFGSSDDIMSGVYDLCSIAGTSHNLPRPPAPAHGQHRTAGWRYMPKVAHPGDRNDKRPSVIIPQPPREIMAGTPDDSSRALDEYTNNDSQIATPVLPNSASSGTLKLKVGPNGGQGGFDLENGDLGDTSRTAENVIPKPPYAPASPRGRTPLRVNIISADTVESWGRAREQLAEEVLYQQFLTPRYDSVNVTPGPGDRSFNTAESQSPMRSPAPPPPTQLSGQQAQQAARTKAILQHKKPTSPPAAAHLRWVWTALQSRESRLGELSQSHQSAVQRVATLEREVILANDLLVEQNAMVERARLAGGLPADDGGGATVTGDGLWSAVVDSAKSNQKQVAEAAVKAVEAKTSMLRKPPAAKKSGKETTSGGKRKTEVKAGVEVEVSEEKLAHFIRKLHQDEGEAVVQIGLDAIKKTVGAPSMKREIKRWMTQQGGGDKTEQSTFDSNGSKYADGINDARAPDEIEKVEFYPDDYKPPLGVRQCVDKISAWQSPIAYLWPEMTFKDMHGSMNHIEKQHSAGQHQNIVVPCYIYSISLFLRVCWVSKYSTKNAKFAWEVLQQQHEHVEKAWAAARRGEGGGGGGDNGDDASHYLSVEPRYFKEITGGAQLLPDGEMRRLAPHSDVYRLDIFRKDKLVFIRYDNDVRGTDISPLYDTILWLPATPLKLEQDGYIFPYKLDDLPPPGLLEYLTSRPTFEKLKWAKDWSVMQAVGEPAISLIKQCLAAVDQQKVEPLLTDKYMKLADNLDRIHHKVKKKDAVYQQGLEALRLILRYRFPSNQASLYTPQAIAHALDIQKLSYSGKTYFINLCSPPFLVVELRAKMEPVEMQRLKHPFPDQIYWHINASLRNQQFKRGCTLHVRSSSKKDIDGRYTLLGNAPTFEDGLVDLATHKEGFHFQREAQPLRRAHSSAGAKKYWIFTGANGVQVTQAKPDQVHIDIGTWFQGQARPICYYLDKSLNLLRDIDASKLDAEVTAPREGVKNYRGLSGVVLDRNVYDTNRIILWGQFSSSSVDRGVASAFAKGSDCAAVFTIIGRSCVRIAQWSRFAREHEWLYQPNSIFKVTACLSEEHQQILDKENLQLFSMEEVDEFEAIETHLRGVVPSIKGEDAPAHVMQLFTIIHHLTKRDTENCLNCLLNPTEQAMFTEQGVKLAHNLMKLIKSGVKTCFLTKEDAGRTPTQPHVAEPKLTEEEQIKVNQQKAKTVVGRNFLQAAELGSEEALDLLLDLGAELETTGTGALTALQRAAIGGHSSVVRRLVTMGANQEACGGGFRAIELAALRRDHALTEMLRESCPKLADLVPHKLEEFQPRVKLPPMGVLKTAVEAAKLKWDRTRAKHSEQQAVVVLFDREKNLFWLRFDDESTDLYPASVLTKPAASTQLNVERRKSVVNLLALDGDASLSVEQAEGSMRGSASVRRGSMITRNRRSPSVLAGRRPSAVPQHLNKNRLRVPTSGDLLSVPNALNNSGRLDARESSLQESEQPAAVVQVPSVVTTPATTSHVPTSTPKKMKKKRKVGARP